MTIVLLPDLALPIWEFSSYQPPSGYLSITRSASGRSARDLRRQQAQGVPKACKKAGFAPTGAVCRSGTRLPVHSRASPHPEGKAVRLFRISSTRHRHLAGRGQGAKRPCRCDQQRNPRVSGGTWGNPDRTSAASGPDNTDSRFRRRSGGSGGRRRGCSRRVRHRGRATPYTL